jgi:hypothetical protein
MLVEKQIVVLALMPKQNNENEHVIAHVDIDACEILNLTCNLLPHPSFLFKMMGGFFWANLQYLY